MYNLFHAACHVHLILLNLIIINRLWNSVCNISCFSSLETSALWSQHPQNKFSHYGERSLYCTCSCSVLPLWLLLSKGWMTPVSLKDGFIYAASRSASYIISIPPNDMNSLCNKCNFRTIFCVYQAKQN